MAIRNAGFIDCLCLRQAALHLVVPLLPLGCMLFSRAVPRPKSPRTFANLGHFLFPNSASRLVLSSAVCEHVADGQYRSKTRPVNRLRIFAYNLLRALLFAISPAAPLYLPSTGLIASKDDLQATACDQNSFIASRPKPKFHAAYKRGIFTLDPLSPPSTFPLIFLLGSIDLFWDLSHEWRRTHYRGEKSLLAVPSFTSWASLQAAG
jgi:hypothetical protein